MFGKQKFLLAFSWKCLEYEDFRENVHEHFCENFRENVYENENFRENVWNTDIFAKFLRKCLEYWYFREIFAKLRYVFAFRENTKMHFRFNPSPDADIRGRSIRQIC